MLIAPGDLVIGQLYYIVQYAEPSQANPIISTYTYRGKTDSGKTHYFQAAGGILEGNLFMDNADLSSLMDHRGLKEELSRK